MNIVTIITDIKTILNVFNHKGRGQKYNQQFFATGLSQLYSNRIYIPFSQFSLQNQNYFFLISHHLFHSFFHKSSFFMFYLSFVFVFVLLRFLSLPSKSLRLDQGNQCIAQTQLSGLQMSFMPEQRTVNNISAHALHNGKQLYSERGMYIIFWPCKYLKHIHFNAPLILARKYTFPAPLLRKN